MPLCCIKTYPNIIKTAIACAITLYRINLFEYFRLTAPPLANTVIPIISMTSTTKHEITGTM